MINGVREAFRDLMRGNACQEALTHTEFFIQDPPSPSEDPCFHYLPPARSRFDLQVINQAGRLVHLVKIDKCLYTSGDSARCDCALLTNDQAYFVEFKMTDTEATSAGNERYARASDCMRQLEASIKAFIERGAIPVGALVIACACVGRTQQIPYPGADFLKLSASFRERFEGIPIRLRLVINNSLTLS
jgi:hypothetical protein